MSELPFLHFYSQHSLWGQTDNWIPPQLKLNYSGPHMVGVTMPHNHSNIWTNKSQIVQRGIVFITFLIYGKQLLGRKCQALE